MTDEEFIVFAHNEGYTIGSNEKITDFRERVTKSIIYTKDNKVSKEEDYLRKLNKIYHEGHLELMELLNKYFLCKNLKGKEKALINDLIGKLNDTSFKIMKELIAK
jgi:hypothetical protein